MKKLAALAFALALPATAPAFAQNACSVNGVAIEQSRIDQLYSRCAQDPLAGCGKDEMGKSLLFQEALNVEPLRQEAIKMGLGPDPRAVEYLSSDPATTAFHYKEITWPRDQLFKAYVDQANPSEQEVEAARLRLSRFAKDHLGELKEWTYREIRFPDLGQAQAALKAIKAGRPFAEAAAEQASAKGAQPEPTPADPNALKKAIVTNEKNDRLLLGRMGKGDVSEAPVYDEVAQTFSIVKIESVGVPANVPDPARAKEGARRYLKEIAALEKIDGLVKQARFDCANADDAKTAQSGKGAEELKDDMTAIAYLWR